MKIQSYAQLKRALWHEALERWRGNKTACNGVCSRSPKLFGRYFLCWRCIGLYASFFPSLLLISELNVNGVMIKITVFILMLPVFIDWTIQEFGGVESKNWRRVVTGFLGGIGAAIIRVMITEHF